MAGWRVGRAGPVWICRSSQRLCSGFRIKQDPCLGQPQGACQESRPGFTTLEWLPKPTVLQVSMKKKKNVGREDEILKGGRGKIRSGL